MEIRKLYIQNFLAVGQDPVILDFSCGNGITLIKGVNQDVSGKSSNGSGKSTIIEAIFFALTGFTLRKLTSSGIIHNKATDECKVEIEFDNVKIVRSLKRHNKAIKSSVDLYVDGDQKTTASVVETNKLIDNIVGINFETLSNILIFGQHNIVSFLDTGEKEKREIIENLMSLKEYNKYEEIAKSKLKDEKANLKSLTEKHNLVTSHKAEQQILLDSQIVAFERYINKLKLEIDALDQDAALIPNIDSLRVEWEQYNDYIKNVSLYEKKIQSLNEELNRLKFEYNQECQKKIDENLKRQPIVEKISSLKNKFSLLDNRKKELWDQNVVSLEEKIKVQQKSLLDLQNTFNNEIKSIKISEDWDIQIQGLNKLVKQSSDRIYSINKNDLKDKDVCPVCYGTVDIKNAALVIEAINSEIKEIEEKIEKLKLKKQEDLNRISDRKSELLSNYNSKKIEIQDIIKKYEDSAEIARNDIKQKYSEAKEKLENLIKETEKELDDFDIELDAKFSFILSLIKSNINNVENDIKINKNSIQNLTVIKKPLISLDEIGKLESKLEIYKKLKEEKENLIKNNPSTDIIASLKDSILKIDSDLKAISDDINKSEKQLPYLDFWVSHMGKEGIKSYVINQIIPTLNEQIEYWMQIIYQNSITVKFDKYFNVSMINNASKNEMVFGQGSGGERRRIDIAIMLAFRQIMKLSTGKDPNIMFFDEPIENLDEEGTYRFFDVLQDMSKNTHIYVITHNPTMLSLLQNKPEICVYKQSGAMRVKTI